jgi:hypothetical protein
LATGSKLTGHIADPALPKWAGPLSRNGEAGLPTAGTKNMLGCGNSGSDTLRCALCRGLADFVLALCLFWGAVLVVSDVRAHGVSLQTLRSSPLAHPGDGDPRHASIRSVEPRTFAHSLQGARADGGMDFVLLSVAFAALAAGNLAFWRHLRRVYASPRRSVWRRG